MQAYRLRTDERAVETSLLFLEEILKGYGPRDFAVRFWDGWVWRPDGGQKERFTLALNHPGALRKMLWPPNDLSLCEAYIHKDFDVEGEKERAFELGDYFRNLNLSFSKKIRLKKMLFGLPSGSKNRKETRTVRPDGRRHSKKRDRQAIAYHYDVSNRFYSLWLDKRMVYSCAYFKSPEEDIDTAQERKLDCICKKLRLSAGDRLLDVGCGWGGLIIHAAWRYGATAVGVTLSVQQAELANRRIREAGLEQKCRVEVMDYRDLDRLGSFDKAASVGMVEHVGESKLDEYFEKIFKALRPGGLFLNHGITSHALNTEFSLFSVKYVFPDGELVPINVMLKSAESSGFEVRDVESLREHYVLTLRKWLSRLEANYEKAREETSETTCRIWFLYMTEAARRFAKGKYNVCQSLLVKPDKGESRMPLTRADLY